VKVKMVCLEDGITSCGFRKMAAYVARINADTEALYVTTGRYRGIRAALFGLGSGGGLTDDEVDEIAQGLLGADLIGFSSMTGYADLTRRVSQRLRTLDPSVYQVWGGIHPIIQPEDAITADVDAICTGEGEFAFQEFFEAFENNRDSPTPRASGSNPI
jgi:anaerobic magnesium-protoporphyrin IX monomethyl ester cyclase